MRHRHSGRQLNRNSSHRKAMFRNMTVSLVEHELDYPGQEGQCGQPTPGL
jgi:hypothetical protein